MTMDMKKFDASLVKSAAELDAMTKEEVKALPAEVKAATVRAEIAEVRAEIAKAKHEALHAALAELNLAEEDRQMFIVLGDADPINQMLMFPDPTMRSVSDIAAIPAAEHTALLKESIMSTYAIDTSNNISKDDAVQFKAELDKIVAQTECETRNRTTIEGALNAITNCMPVMFNAPLGGGIRAYFKDYAAANDMTLYTFSNFRMIDLKGLPVCTASGVQWCPHVALSSLEPCIIHFDDIDTCDTQKLTDINNLITQIRLGDIVLADKTKIVLSGATIATSEWSALYFKLMARVIVLPLDSPDSL